MFCVGLSLAVGVSILLLNRRRTCSKQQFSRTRFAACISQAKMAERCWSLACEIVKIPVLVVENCVRQMRYVFIYDKEIMLLQDKLRLLEAARYDLQRSVDEATSNLELIDPNVLMWLTNVEDILQDGEYICEIGEARRSCFCDVRSRHNLAKKTNSLLRVINELEYKYATWSYTGSRTNNSSYANEIVGFMDVVLKVLKNGDQNSIVGLYGVVGNSERAAIQVCKKAKEEKIFDEVVMVNVMSTHPNLYMIQRDLEKKLGLEFEEGKSLSERGEIVEERLSNRRVLVVLYNVKEKFELRDIGIQSVYPRSKFVVISSELSICEGMGIQTIFQVPIVVKDEEIWDHFMRMAGDWVQKAGRDCIANEILNQYCGGYSESQHAEIRRFADNMNKWIKRIEISNGINAPDAREAINRRRMNLFAAVAQSSRAGFLRLC